MSAIIDVELNAFFQSPEMIVAARNTQLGYAGDLARFLTFLWVARDVRDWRTATESDHVAYLTWRLRDPAGPMVAPSTWDREVASVNAFYSWQLREGTAVQSPIPQARRRVWRRGRGFSDEGTRPATYSHAAATERVQWLPPQSYRMWRDVGLRGYSAEGLPRREFRGRWRTRNATFSDLMVRTGLRLSEQTSLTVFDVPTSVEGTGYRRFWLPPAVAKNGSARWIYVPVRVLREVKKYREDDRADVIEKARAAGRYDLDDVWIVERGDRATASRADGTTVPVARLDPIERRRLFVRTPAGVEPAALWLSERGEAPRVSWRLG